MKKINFFDLGMNKGAVCDHFLNSTQKEGLDVNIIGFEPMPDLFLDLQKKYKGKDNIEIHQLAISKNSGFEKIYSANCAGGHSLFKDHQAVENQPAKNKTSFNVKSIKFSDFIIENYKKYKIDNSINILKSNIEGAEFYLFNDIIDTGIHKKFHIFCGTPNSSFDVYKVKSLKSSAGSLLSKMHESGIIFNRYTSIYGNPCPSNFNMIKCIKNIKS
jgi:FkbM family methyltransferase